MKRRDFLKATALVAATSAVIPSFSFVDKKKIGLQLWSVKDVIGADVKGVLKQLADFGYKELETFGYTDGKLFGMKSKEFSDIVKGLGMKITSGHYGTGQTNPQVSGTLTKDWEKAAFDAKDAGQEYMIVAYLQADERKTLDDYKKVCGLMNKAGEICKKYGLRLGYHNHNFEFEKVEGQVPYDLMLKELDPKVVSMEMDLYWVVNAGYDPITYFGKYPGRFEQWHIKDMDKTDKMKNADIGTGTINFKSLFAKSEQAGLKHFYIEQENWPVSPIESAKVSIKNLEGILG